MPLNNRKELLSITYLKAICAKVGCNISTEQHYDHGVDAVATKIDEIDGKTIPIGINLEIQLKCSRNVEELTNGVKYSLKK